MNETPLINRSNVKKLALAAAQQPEHTEAKTAEPRALAPAACYLAGERVRVHIPGHRWHGLTGVTKFGGNGSHYIVCDSGREIAPVRTEELLPDNVQR